MTATIASIASIQESLASSCRLGTGSISQLSLSFRQELKNQPTIKEHPFLLRYATSQTVLACFGSVFRDVLQGNVAAGTHGKSTTKPTVEDGNTSCGPAQHQHADEIFYSAHESTFIDVFISHVWSSAWWAKVLALLFYQNCKIAVVIATLVWMLSGIVCVIYMGNGQYDALGGKDLTLQLVHMPTLVFFAIIIFGHHITGSAKSKMWWIDKVCIHQSRQDIKILGVTALPEFVVASTEMVVLWSENYFERLWCCAEVATFVACNEGAGNLTFLPLWMPQWILCTIATDMLSAYLFNRFAWLFPWVGAMVMKWGIFETDVAILVGMTIAASLTISVAYLPACLANFFGFRQKVRTHRSMIEQISTFSLRNAKCTIESDRDVVEVHVGRLFLPAGYEKKPWDAIPKDVQFEAINSFDNFVRNDLLEVILQRIGHVSYIPYTIALLVFLPLNFESYVNVLGCDFGPCSVNAPAEGYASVPMFMLGTSLNWVLSCSLVLPATYPLMLWGLSASMDYFEAWPVTNAVCCMVVVVASYFYAGVGMGLVVGFVGNAFTFGLKWIILLVLFVFLLLSWNYYMFVTRRHVKPVKSPDAGGRGWSRLNSQDTGGRSYSPL